MTKLKAILSWTHRRGTAFVGFNLFTGISKAVSAAAELYKRRSY